MKNPNHAADCTWIKGEVNLSFVNNPDHIIIKEKEMDYIFNGYYNKIKFNYCPHCGIKL